MVRLSAHFIADITDGISPSAVQALNVRSKGIDGISGMDEFPNLTRLDLSDNAVSSLGDLKSCVNLKWLSLANNQLNSIQGLEELTKLTVLNCASNSITRLEPVALLRNLKALVLNDNDIVSVPPLKGLPELNTLVLSHNQIEELGASLESVPSLTKLSLSNNQLTDLGGALRGLPRLTELRLAHNQLTRLPPELELNHSLTTLDVGGNHVKKLSAIKVLGTLKHLRSLNLKGNPVRDKAGTQEDYERKVLALIPSLQILDGHRLDAAATTKSTGPEAARGGGSTAARKGATELDGGDSPMGEPRKQAFGSSKDTKEKRKELGPDVEQRGVTSGSVKKSKLKAEAAEMGVAPTKAPASSRKESKSDVGRAVPGGKLASGSCTGGGGQKDSGDDKQKQAELVGSKEGVAALGKGGGKIKKGAEEKNATKAKSKRKDAKVEGAEKGVTDEGKRFLDMVLGEVRQAGGGFISVGRESAAGPEGAADSAKAVNVPPAVSGLVKVVYGAGRQGASKKKGGPQAALAAPAFLLPGDGQTAVTDAVGLGGSSAWDKEEAAGGSPQDSGLSGRAAEANGPKALPFKRKVKTGSGPPKKKKKPAA